MAKYISKLINGEELYYLKDSEARTNKADKSATVSTVSYDTTNKKITKTINGTTSDVVTAAKIVTDGGGITSHQNISGKVDKTTTVNGHALSSNVTVTKSDVGLGNVTNDAQVKRSEMGAASGVATLDSAGKVPSSQLPSYVDDVLEYDTKSDFPTTGEAGKIYVDKSTSTTWRWSGSAYTQIKGDLTIGTTTGTAADGGVANTHYNNKSNPHSVTKAQVGLGSVVNTGDSATPVSGGITKFTTGGAYTELNKKVDKVSGKGLSTNDYTTDEKNKLSGIASGAQINVIETVKVNGTALTPSSKAVDVTVPTKTSELTNNSNFVSDASYVHTDNNYTATEKSKLSGIASGAEVNQNAFSNIGVKVGSTTTTVAADAKTDTITLIQGSNITLTPDATNDTVTIAAKDTIYSAATTSTAGLMSADDKTKLNGIATGATNVTTDTVSGWGYTKNTGTVTSVAVKMNGASKGTVTTSGTIDLGTVLTSHQDISGKVDKTITVNGHALSGNVSVTKSDVGLGNVTNDSQVKRSEMGAASGVATLDSSGKVPSSQLPSYVDDVIEGYFYNSKFYKESGHTTEITGETGKIYVDLSTNKTYRWGGSAYAVISETLALGETSSTAYRGDRGKTAYTHSQTTSGNPHNVTKSDVGLGNVGNFKAVSTVASQGLTDTEKSNARTNIGAGTSSFSGSYNDLSNKPTIPAAAANGTYTVKTLVGSTTTNVSDFTANQSSADDVTFVQGSNVTITPDATNRKITIAAKDTTYSSKSAASGGTDVSLVTTGEKYTWNSKTSNTGTVTKVTAGTGLTGGDITTTGTIALATSGVTAGTYNSVTVDLYGRVTAGTLSGGGSQEEDGVFAVTIDGTEVSYSLIDSGNPSLYVGVSVKNSIYGIHFFISKGFAVIGSSESVSICNQKRWCYNNNSTDLSYITNVSGTNGNGKGTLIGTNARTNAFNIYNNGETGIVNTNNIYNDLLFNNDTAKNNSVKYCRSVANPITGEYDGYLGSLAEWIVLSDNITQVNNIMAIIGGTLINSYTSGYLESSVYKSYFYTSTEIYSSYVWVLSAESDMDYIYFNTLSKDPSSTYSKFNIALPFFPMQ